MNGTRAFRVATTGARLVTGVVVAVACVVGVTVGVHAAWPQVTHEPASVEVTPLPGDSVLVCNGDLRALGRDSSAPLDMRSAASPEFTADGTNGAPDVELIDTPDLIDAGEVRLLTGTVEGREVPLIGAAESVSVAADDLAGLAALPCGEPRLESWLVGGSVGTGTSDLVILTNAAEVPTTVTLSVYGTLRSARTVVVAPRTQVALPLTSIAAGNESPVVKVTSVGAPVRAVLQSSLIRVLDPAGIDLQEAVAGAQENVVLAGVQTFAVDGDDADTTVLRLLAPGADAQARISVRPTGSAAPASEFSVPLRADEPADAALSGLEPGTYSVEVEADAPVVAAVRQHDGEGAGADFAWVTPAPEIDSDVLVAIPAGPSPQLQLVNTTETDATVSLEPVGGGDAQEVVVPAGASRSLAVEADTTYRLRPSGTVHGAVSMTAPGALAVLAVQPGAGAEQSITVYP
ncbi:MULTISPECIES: DUF5719 family protein [unclassified Microbacterium]|uniref:DUF5719 family protein n=1 Tax=unclassified Microbacterium TaxID=2609290 RepID=UPI000EAA4F08|nr:MULTISPECIES: DUF5719 family protein [unclassified Microbacterium]MBT2485415.1 hypothetical protein [Microbacterium sp. ISL-108]RKN68215.1 hypothetical protein D7252_11900 [Microbacterium sp. CGR2]